MARGDGGRTIDPDCEVCRGSGKLRVALHWPVDLVCYNEAVVEPRPMSREYPCPECHDLVQVTRLSVMQLHHETEAVEAAGFRDFLRGGMARKLGAGILEAGLMHFKERAAFRSGQPSREVIGYVYVVAPADAELSLNVRVRQRAEELLAGFAAKAKDQIRHWGSYYGAWSIGKDDACRMVDEGVKMVRHDLQRWQDMPK